MDRFCLTEVASMLSSITVGGITKTYPQLWRAVVDGKLKPERYGRRYFFSEADLPQIARAMGLPLREPLPTILPMPARQPPRRSRSVANCRGVMGL